VSSCNVRNGSAGNITRTTTAITEKRKGEARAGCLSEGRVRKKKDLAKKAFFLFFFLDKSEATVGLACLEEVLRSKDCEFLSGTGQL
jgi:hypothetical protein